MDIAKRQNAFIYLHTHDDTSTNASASRRARLRRHLKYGMGIAILLNAVLLLKILSLPLHIPKPKIVFGSADQDIDDPCDGPRRSHERFETVLPISGEFRLYDDLHLKTTTGSINIVIYPQPGCGASTLTLESTVGSIYVTFAFDDDVDEPFTSSQVTSQPGANILSSTSKSGLHLDDGASRPLNARVKTTTGSIVSTLPLGNGSMTSLTSTVGMIDSTFYLHHAGPPDPASELFTSSNVGSQNIVIVSYPPVSPTSDTDQDLKKTSNITNLRAKHEVKGSAGLKLTYPPEWTGQIHAKANGPGLVHVSGQDLEYITKESRDVFAFREKPSSSSSSSALPSDKTNKEDEDSSMADLNNINNQENPKPIPLPLPLQLIEATTWGPGSITFNADGVSRLHSVDEYFS